MEKGMIMRDDLKKENQVLLTKIAFTAGLATNLKMKLGTAVKALEYIADKTGHITACNERQLRTCDAGCEAKIKAQEALDELLALGGETDRSRI